MRDEGAELEVDGRNFRSCCSPAGRGMGEVSGKWMAATFGFVVPPRGVLSEFSHFEVPQGVGT